MATIAVLGGSGLAGRGIAQFLLDRKDVTVVLMGRTQSTLEDTARSLGGDRVIVRQVDARDPGGLREALTDIDLLVVAAPLLETCEEIARAALDTGTDWLDIMLDIPPKLQALNYLGDEFEEAGLKLIAGTGAHPGLPAVMVRALADEFTDMTDVEVGMLMAMDWKNAMASKDTAAEFAVEGLHFRSAGWVNGEYRSYSWIDPRATRRIDFGPPFGKRGCVCMELAEIKGLKALYPKLINASMFMAGFSPIVDWIIMPTSIMMITISKKLAAPATKLLWWGLERFSKPPYGLSLTVDAEGSGHAPITMTLKHEDGYWLTSAVAAATIDQYLDGMITAPGLHQAALVVDPHRLLADLEARGIEIDRT
ncbi:MAG: saccharopine dehydrogenase NADP-binding domain-containing protein [Propionibacteriaceae bacterium]|nr:saccharopine dehydrogenase NADP-binding domain-containing protein [Propionibacteriaceae bacterium]